MARGNVSAIDVPFNNAKLLQFTADIQPGNSGSPLLDDAGNVIGMVVSNLDVLEKTSQILQNVNFAIEALWVRNFLDIHGINYRSLSSETKLDPEKLAELAEHFTVAVVRYK